MDFKSRNQIISEINQLLTEEGFETSNIYSQSCFDMFAKRKLLLILLKALVNIDTIYESHANEIKKISSAFHASPLIVGSKSRNTKLEEDVVYERHGIPAIGVETLKNMIIYGDCPEILADHGGYYVHINGDLLKEYRQDYSLSLKDLADLAHVTRETIYKYENGIARASTETAMALEEILNIKITLDIDILKINHNINTTNLSTNINSNNHINNNINSNNHINNNINSNNHINNNINSNNHINNNINSNNINSSNINTKSSNLNSNNIEKDLNEEDDKTKDLTNLGFGVVSTKKTPFDTIAKIDNANNANTSFIANLEEKRSSRSLQKIAISLKDLSLITSSESFFMINNIKTKEAVDGIPVVKSWEIKELEDYHDFLKIINERKENS
ncbi:hypothetical protein MBFIL_19410 [Methanobrevibacter filiformis]|uniref:Putative HTH-type transcriptional regulatory protein MBFIL_19410 n=1 Tax=Methanobrevibacter filiformis TaxID=55758 RepID=A0A165YXK9_9EURY|nr:helix-turn-helix domain-containing protein [Methanobrevibacter filiformis]KZX09991.1 hypothetical protein MBFIL_19410 [Methanobrevibacter filiformis]